MKSPRSTKLIDVLVFGLIALIVGIVALPSFVGATGITAATYVKTSDVIVKVEGGHSMHLVAFTMTGGSGDTYLTGGPSPSASATGLGFTAFKAGTLKCDVNAVAWGAYTTAAGAVVVRSATVQLANTTSINGTVFTCTGIAY